MRKVLITESSLRGLLRELINSNAPIFPNPVVDPQAAETNPTNQNFVPSDKPSFLSAFRALIDSVDDEKIPQIYVVVKDAIEKEEAEMKKAITVETIIRTAIRKILKEALPVSPPPKMPILDKLSASSALDDEIKAKVDSGAPVEDVVRLLKTKGFKGSEASLEAQRIVNKIRAPKNVKAQEEFLQTKQVTKLPSMFKPWPVEVYKGPQKSLASKASDFADSYLFKIDFSKMLIGEVGFDLAGKAYKNAYLKTMQKMPGTQPYEIVDSKQFKNNFQEYLVVTGISNPPSLDNVLQQIGIQSSKVLGETLISRIDEAEYRIEDKEIEIIALDPTDPKDEKTRQNISKAVYTLNEVSKVLKLSVSMIKKTEVKALGKYVLGIKSELFEFIPVEPKL
jgi:hypothetical protein